MARVAWWLFAVTALGAAALMTQRSIMPGFYRIDVDVYRQGAQTWLDGHQLYGDVQFLTHFPDYYLPFTYPPISAIVFSPMTWATLPTATTILTVTTSVLLVCSTAIVLTALDVWPSAPKGYGPAWFRRISLAAAITAALIWVDMEPISNNFACGQINVVLMTLVLADTLLPRTRGAQGQQRKTLWPRGLLVGIAISIKLTPAVFLVYFVLRRDWRAAGTALATFAASIVIAFVFAPRDSWEYWTGTLRNTGRIGDVARDTNQNLAGTLARFGLTGWPHTLLWLTACVAVLALTVWAARRVLRAQPVLALMCVALFGLLVSPISWSHHWVWFVPVVVALTVTGFRTRNGWLVAAALAGLAMMRWSPVRDELIDGEVLQQFTSAGYVWWALAVMTIVGVTAARTVSPRRSPESVRAADSTVGQPSRP